MEKVTAEINKTKNGFTFPSEYSRKLLLSWFKKYKAFSIEPIINESQPVRGYLEGAIVSAYCHWQYGIDPRAKGKSEQRRFLFKRDFNYDIVENRDGEPIRIPRSSKGKAAAMTNLYTQWAQENGAPVPNTKLYKLWRDKYSSDLRFPTFFDFLNFLELECDAMPSSQTLEKLNKEEVKINYPENKLGEPIF